MLRVVSIHYCAADIHDIYRKVYAQLDKMWLFQLSLLVFANLTIKQNFTNSFVHLTLVQLPGVRWVHTQFVNI